MFIEFLTFGTGAVVLLGGASARMAAARGRSLVADDEAPAPRMAVITQAALEAVPLVAPDRAGYGTASRLLLQAAALHRPTPVAAPDSGRRKAA